MIILKEENEKQVTYSKKLNEGFSIHDKENAYTLISSHFAFKEKPLKSKMDELKQALKQEAEEYISRVLGNGNTRTS